MIPKYVEVRILIYSNLRCSPTTQHNIDELWIFKDSSKKNFLDPAKFLMETSELQQGRLQSRLDGTA